MSYRCGVALDIGPDMTAWPCFPLASFDRRSIFEFETPSAMRKHYSEAFREIREQNGMGLFEECADCRFHERGRCSAGCLSHVIPTDRLARERAG